MKSIIETKRLFLREFKISDASFFYELNNDPVVMKYTGDVPFATVNEAHLFIKNYSHYQEYGFGRWTVVLKDSLEPIGWCGLKYHKEGFIDIGYRFAQKYWGKGYATEAAISCMEFGRALDGEIPIWGRVDKKNATSIKVLEKLGLNFFKVDFCEGLEGVLYYK
ncbi:MAG: GNAT family N-acetyltransferase [Salibacteraceae bacterium]